MFLFRLTTKNHPCPLLLVYIPDSSSDLRIHRPIRNWIYLLIMMLSFQLTKITYLSTQLLVYMTTHAPVHQPTCLFWYFHSDNRYGLPVRFATALLTYTGLPIHQYIPIEFNLPFRQTTHSYMSTHLLVYIHTQVYPSINTYLFSLIFPSGKTRTVTCQLIYWSTYPQTFQKIYRPVYVDGFLPATHKDLHARIKDINYKNVQVEH